MGVLGQVVVRWKGGNRIWGGLMVVGVGLGGVGVAVLLIRVWGGGRR